jgi:hypothetical protein
MSFQQALHEVQFQMTFCEVFGVNFGCHQGLLNGDQEHEEMIHTKTCSVLPRVLASTS